MKSETMSELQYLLVLVEKVQDLFAFHPQNSIEH